MELERPTVCKTFKYKLQPTPEQEETLAFVVRRCRELYNAALQERRHAWHTSGVSITVASQSAQLPAIKEVRPEYCAIYSQVLQDVLTRLDRAFAAFFRRVQQGEQPGYPRCQGANRYTSFTYKQFSNGATLDNGFLVLSKIGRLAVRWSRPLVGTPKTVTISREADGWHACFSCADVPIEPLPPTRQQTGIDVGLKVFLITAEGDAVEHPGTIAKRKSSLPRPSGAFLAASRAAIVVRRRSPCSSATIKRSNASGVTFTTRRRSRCYGSTTSSISKTCGSPIWCAIPTSPRASRMRRGISFAPSWPAKQHTLAGGSCWCHPPTPARTVAACCRMGATVGSGCPRASRSAPTSVLPVGWCSTATRTRHETFSGPGRPVRERGRWSPQ